MIGFEIPEYSVKEGDGLVEVCVVIEEGSLQRPVLVTLSTSDFSATRKETIVQIPRSEKISPYFQYGFNRL